MSQLGVIDLPARKKKKRKRKNISTKQESTTDIKTDDTCKHDQIFETANDFIIYSLKKQGIDLNFPHNETKQDQEHHHSSSDTNQDNDIKTDINDNENNDINNSTSNASLTQKIHAFNTNPSATDPNTLKASQYLKQLRKQDTNSNTEQSSDNDSNPIQSEDPLLTLLNIKPKEKDKPTTIEYDDRVYDKVIFQDEEFKEYRKNNIAVNDKKLFQNSDIDKIIHQRTDVSAAQNTATDEQHYNDEIEYENEQEYYDYKFEQRAIPKNKLRPNYFIALKITDRMLKRKLQTAQSILMKELNDKIFERALIDENTFHITLNAIYCDNDDEVFYLMNQFEEFGKNMLQKLIPTKLSVRLHVNGIGHFRQNVIYGCIEDDMNKSKLENVYHALHTQFKNAGIINQQHKFDPHLTIMKLSKIRNDKGLVVPMSVIDKMNNEYNKSLDFGYQYVNGLELLSMIDERNNDDVDDYYQCISTIAPMKLR